MMRPMSYSLPNSKLGAATVKRIRSMVLPKAEWHGQEISFKSVLPSKLSDYNYYSKKFFARIHDEPDSYGHAIVTFMDVTWSLMREDFGAVRIGDALRYNENPYTAMTSLLGDCIVERRIYFGQSSRLRLLDCIADANASYKILRAIPKVMIDGVKEYNEGLEKLNLFEAAEKRQKLAEKIYRRLQILIE